MKELHIEPQQPNLAKGEKSTARETHAYTCWDSLKHTAKQVHFRDGHACPHMHAETTTCTRMHIDHARRDLSHTDTIAVPCGTRTRHGVPSGAGRRVCKRGVEAEWYMLRPCG